MKIVYFGTPLFSAAVLRYLLHKKGEIVAVVTQPDRPKGRSGALAPSPVCEVAKEASIPIFQPEKCSQEYFLQEMANLGASLYVVVAFGQILPQKLLDIPPLGCINVHASLLPLYRGAAPMQRSLMDGVSETGVSIQKMVRQLDAGDVIAEAKIPVPLEMTFGELEQELRELSKPLLLSVIEAFKERIPPAAAQDTTKVTLAPKIETEECEIDWSGSAEKIHNKIRALSPRPGAWCWIEVEGEKRRFKILRTRLVSTAEIGPVKHFSLAEGTIQCGIGSVQLLEVQPESKKIMSGVDWLRGLKASPKF